MVVAGCTAAGTAGEGVEESGAVLKGAAAAGVLIGDGGGIGDGSSASVIPEEITHKTRVVA